MILATLLSLLAQQPGGGALIPQWTTELDFVERLSQLIAAPDLNGDGVDEWLVSIEGELNFQTFERGVLAAYSGADGAELWRVWDTMALGVEFVDFEQDGQWEVVVRRNQELWDGDDAGVRILEGNSGAIRGNYSRGPGRSAPWMKLVAADVDRDGQLELIGTDDTYAKGGPNVVGLESDGTILWEIAMNEDDVRVTVLLEDLDADGEVDVVIADAGYEDIGGPKNVGRIWRADPATGATIWEVYGPEEQALLGSELETVDLDADGNRELMTRAMLGDFQARWGAGSVALFDSAGQLRWRVGGENPQDWFGETYSLGDCNGDGVQDVLIGSPLALRQQGEVRAIDGVAGSVVWRVTDWPGIQEQFGKSVHFFPGVAGQDPWVIVKAVYEGAWGQMLAGIDFRNARTGVSLASHRIDERADSSIQVVNVDGDPDPEVLYTETRPITSGGLMGVVDPVAGVLWQHVGDGIYGAMLPEPAPGQAPLVLARHRHRWNELGDRGMVRALDLQSGTERWVRCGEVDRARLDELKWAEGPRGRTRVAHELWSGYPFGPLVRIFDAQTGAWLHAFYGSDSLFPPRVSLARDGDGDGLREVGALHPGLLQQFPAHLPKRPFVDLQGDTVSVSQGGSSELTLRFTEEARWGEYRLMASASGTGESWLDAVPVPLTEDALYQASLHGDLLRAMVPHATGILDAQGRASIDLHFSPGQLSTSWVGRTLQLCVLVREPWSAWSACSVPVSIQLLP